MLVDLAAKSAEVYRRIELQVRLEQRPDLQAIARACFAVDVAEWINDWCWSYSPKDLTIPTEPFQLSLKQAEMIRWIDRLILEGQEGVLEKSRDVGVSWTLALYALNRFLFVPGFKTTLASYEAAKVDHLGDPDSLFEKIRIAMDMLPRWQLPQGWDVARHDNFMRLVNPENDNTIVGEVGRNIGRGGRSTLLIADEAAYLEHFPSAARAVSANADAKIWASTAPANGMANGFYLKREATRQRDPTLLFRMHWRDDPRKTEEWAEKRKAEMDPVDWAIEHEIDYGAATERQLIRAEWVRACHELWTRYKDEDIEGTIRSGLDVGAGKAESVLATVKGPALIDLSAWRDPDAVDTASMAIDQARELRAIAVLYDATGVGFGQGAIMARMASDLKQIGVNLGEPPPKWAKVEEGDKMVPASDRFANIKAWGWWQLRERCKASWEEVEGVKGHDPSDCLLLGVTDPILDAQLTQPTWSKNLRGKVQVDKAPQGAKSPDRADALVLALLDPPPPRLLQRGQMLGI